MSAGSAPGPSAPADGTRRNAADRAYLLAEEARLVVAVTQSLTASSFDAPREGRDLAERAHAAQVVELGDVRACTETRGRPGPDRREVPGQPGRSDPGAPPEPGADFATRLGLQAREAIRSARAEMIAGSDPVVRHLAEASIRAHSRQLSDLAAPQPASNAPDGRGRHPGQTRGRC